MCKKLYNFMLAEEEVFRIGTKEQINQLVKETGFPIWIKTLTNRKMLERYICEGAEDFQEGIFFEIDNYYVIFTEDGEMDFYSKKDVTKEMLKGILETYCNAVVNY